MELAPFPADYGRTEWLPGFHRAMSLHPSRCERLCLPGRVQLRLEKAIPARESAAKVESLREVTAMLDDPLRRDAEPAKATSAPRGSRPRGRRASRQPAAEPSVEVSRARAGCAGSTSSAPARWTAPGSRSTSSSTRSTTRTSAPATSARRSTSTSEYLFIVLHFPVFDKKVGRLNAGELDIFIGPDFLITIPNSPLQPVEYLFERCRASEEPARASCSPRARATCSTRSSTTPSTTASRCCARSATSSSGSRRTSSRARAEEVVRDISNAKQEIINFRKVIRPQRTRAARPRAHQAALPGARTWRSTSTTSSTPPSASGTCSRTTRRSSRRSRTRTSR